MRERERERGGNLAVERGGSRTLFPDADGFVAAARGEYRGHTVDAGGRFPGEAPNPIGVALEFLNFTQLEIRHTNCSLNPRRRDWWQIKANVVELHSLILASKQMVWMRAAFQPSALRLFSFLNKYFNLCENNTLERKPN